MRFIIIVRANGDSEAGIAPAEDRHGSGGLS